MIWLALIAVVEAVVYQRRYRSATHGGPLEAAWWVWGECEKNVIALVEAHGGSCDVNPGAYMLEYGPRPEGGTR